MNNIYKNKIFCALNIIVKQGRKFFILATVAVRDQKTHKLGYHLTESEVFPICHNNMWYIELINLYSLP